MPDAEPTDAASARERRPTRYQPHPAEVDGAVKRTAARAVEALPDVRRAVGSCVLRSDRITLPWAGRVDVAAGLVSDTVLRSMLAVAERHRIGVSVLISAHPVHVFGTDRRSRHPDGLAYDIGTNDGQLVVDPAAAGLVRRVMRAAAATGAHQVGGPIDLDPRRHFSASEFRSPEDTRLSRG